MPLCHALSQSHKGKQKENGSSKFPISLLGFFNVNPEQPTMPCPSIRLGLDGIILTPAPNLRSPFIHYPR